jgi:Tol biopolymer transport system component
MRFLRIAVALVAPLIVATTLTAQSLDVQLQRAVQREAATGDHKSATAEYKRIADRAGSNKGVGAHALLKLAEAYTALGDAQARTIYEQIVAKYPDQQAVVTTARERLVTVRPVVRQLTRRQILADATSRDIGLATMSVSPDGRFLLFPLNNRTQLIARDLTTGIERVLLRDDASIHIQPLMSPDGKRIVYGFGRNAPDAPGEIRIMNSDATGQRTVVTLPRSEISGSQMLAWSPDGTRILTINRTGQGAFRLRWMSTTNGQMSPLFDGVAQGNFDAEISPDGRYVAVGGVRRGDKREIVVVASDGTRSMTLSDNGNDMMPVGWSPDGRSVVIASRRAASVGLWRIPVTNGALAGEPVHVAEVCDCDVFTSYGMTKSGAFYFGATVNQGDIYTAARDPRTGLATSPRTLINAARRGRNASPLWSNSQQLLYYWSAPTLRELSVYSPSTGVERRLSGVTLGTAGVCWSGDDGVLVRRSQGGRIVFTRVDLNTRAEKVVFDEPADGISASACSPDGRFVAYRTAPTSAASGAATSTVIKVRDTLNGSTSELRAAVSTSLSAPAISHDGKLIAFVGISEGENGALYVGQAGGTDVRRVTIPRLVQMVLMGPKPVTWSPDSRFLYYSRRERVGAPWELYVISVDSGDERKVDLSGGDVRDVTVSPDGTLFAFSAGPLGRPEIAVIENFVPE